MSVVAGPVAVVEIGSGSVKLLVVDAAGLATGGADGSPLITRSVKTRLLAGDGATFDPDALAATAAAFRSFADDIAAVGATTVSVVGTSVTRRAADLEPLDALSRTAFGVPIEVLSGEREAELAFAGAAAGRDLPGPLSLIDIGAGSTELAMTIDGAVGVRDADADAAAGAGPESGVGAGAGVGIAGSPTVRSASLPIGSRVLTDAYLHGDPPGPDELSSALSVAELHYDDLRRDLPELGSAIESGTLLGVGALTEIAAVEIGIVGPEESVDGYHLVKAAAEEVFRALATETAEDRAHNPGMKPEHVDDIVGALCVLVEFMRRFDVEEVVVSERGLRHGRAAELLATN